MATECNPFLSKSLPITRKRAIDAGGSIITNRGKITSERATKSMSLARLHHLFEYYTKMLGIFVGLLVFILILETK
jgi:hypothetical protein